MFSGSRFVVNGHFAVSFGEKPNGVSVVVVRKTISLLFRSKIPQRQFLVALSTGPAQLRVQ